MTRTRWHVSRIAAMLVPAATLACHWAVAAPPSRPSSPDPAPARQFLRALLERDEKTLYAFGGEGFLPGGRMTDEDQRFLYEDRGEWKSVTSISALGTLRVVVVPQARDQLIVLYVPAQYQDAIRDPHFLGSKWSKLYFACQFSTSGGHWKLLGNFCFNETDGPYPEED